MNVDSLQRTLIVGLGQSGAQITERLLARLTEAVGPVGIVNAITVGEHPPGEEAVTNWLATFIEQASPFWRYDEAALAEEARAQVQLDAWLFLPGGEASPLASICQTGPQPPHLLASPDRHEAIAVTIRRGVPFDLPPGAEDGAHID